MSRILYRCDKQELKCMVLCSHVFFSHFPPSLECWSRWCIIIKAAMRMRCSSRVLPIEFIEHNEFISPHHLTHCGRYAFACLWDKCVRSSMPIRMSTRSYVIVTYITLWFDFLKYFIFCKWSRKMGGVGTKIAFWKLDSSSFSWCIEELEGDTCIVVFWIGTR